MSRSKSRGTARNILFSVLEELPCVVDARMHYVAYSRRWLEDHQLPDKSLIGRSHYEVFPVISDEWQRIH